jgi:hypothetical protein
MHDELDPNDSRETPSGAKPADVNKARPVADREVPITGHKTPASVQAWLDGEMTESEVRRGGTERDVEFWLRVEREVSVRRQMKTPTEVMERIMEALPADAPRAREPWWHRSFSVTPVVAAAATAGALAVGAVLGATVLRTR